MSNSGFSANFNIASDGSGNWETVSTQPFITDKKQQESLQNYFAKIAKQLEENRQQKSSTKNDEKQQVTTHNDEGQKAALQQLVATIIEIKKVKESQLREKQRNISEKATRLAEAKEQFKILFAHRIHTTKTEGAEDFMGPPSPKKSLTIMLALQKQAKKELVVARTRKTENKKQQNLKPQKTRVILSSETVKFVRKFGH